MTTHLTAPTDSRVLCSTRGRWLARACDLRHVTCKRCAKAIDDEAAWQDEVAAERRRLDEIAEAADFLGAGFVWSLVSRDDTATERMVREILAAVFIGLAEQFGEERAA